MGRKRRQMKMGKNSKFYLDITESCVSQVILVNVGNRRGYIVTVRFMGRLQKTGKILSLYFLITKMLKLCYKWLK